MAVRLSVKYIQRCTDLNVATLQSPAGAPQSPSGSLQFCGVHVDFFILKKGPRNPWKAWGAAMATAAEISEDKGSHIWTLLPTFDPASDNVKEYIEKVKFIDSICPKKDRPMLAPRLAMLCRGTAWGQVKNLPPGTLTDPEGGVKSLLAALSSWEESSEMKTYDQFEKAVYKTVQKSDESSMSFVNRLQVAMDELGAKSIKEFHAFLLLRQSALTPEDKKRVLTMTSGDMDTKKIEQSMRTLATNILSTGDAKKKVYPTNYVEPEPSFVVSEADSSAGSGTMPYNFDDEDIEDYVEQLATQGDADAMNVVSFERDLEDMFQEVPDLHQALISYQEARTKILERKRSRGFWPSGGGSKGKGKGGGKFQSRKGAGKGNLLQRIARTFCKACGEKGDWKAECPNRPTASPDTANYVIHQSFRAASVQPGDGPEQVIFEDEPEEDCMEPHKHVGVDNGDKEDKWGIGCNWGVVGMICRAAKCILNLAKGCIRVQSVPLCPISPHVIPSPISCNPPAIEVAYSLQHLLPNVQQFFGSRLKPRSQKATNAIECFHSRPSLSLIAREGLAILDTGASRSVIGSDLWPGVLKSLPTAVRNQVQEHPSKVGFRFGNNQITYSFKQVRIPIFAHKRRIWIVIEVVPHATPFLISIQAMKALGAMINLSTNQCYLKQIDRELSLQESDNGLYVFRMSDLCTGKSENALAVRSSRAVQVPNISPPPGLSTSESCPDVDSAGRHEDDQSHSGIGDGVVASTPPHIDEPDRSSSPRAGDLRSPCQFSPESTEPCEHAEGPDREVVQDPQRAPVSEEDPKSCWVKAVRAWRPVRSVLGSGGGIDRGHCKCPAAKEEPISSSCSSEYGQR
eukprot:s379_g13.t1